MKRLFTIWTALAAGLLATNHGFAQYAPSSRQLPQLPTTSSRLAAYFDEAAAEADDADEADDAATDEKAEAKQSNCGCEKSTCGCGCEASCGCGNSCGNGCGSSCSCNGDLCSGWSLCSCCPGDAWSLQSELQPCCDKTYSYGGWIAMGYYNDNDRFSFERNDLLSFWDNPDRLNLDQAWFYSEKLAKADGCSADWGYRFDFLYGVDAQKTQAFGNSGFPDADGWDNSWDHGAYGYAVPQLYGEVAYGDMNVKIGHFFTLIGYEVVPATGNFFYSHSYTMFNSEPFTHTGVLGTYTASDDLTLYGGWTLGWDTGFDQFEDGSSFMGGFGVQVTDDVKYTYICTAGDLGWRGDGYSHSNVVDVTLSDRWQYVLQSDLVTTNRPVEDDADDLSYGIVNYLFYTLNDCWKLGGRAEWWKSNQLTGEMTSYYEITGGINYQAHANLVVRPEVKYNWTPSEDAVEDETGEDFNQVLFGIDAVFTF